MVADLSSPYAREERPRGAKVRRWWSVSGGERMQRKLFSLFLVVTTQCVFTYRTYAECMSLKRVLHGSWGQCLLCVRVAVSEHL